MRNEEEFKQTLNNKLGEEQFPFDESNWAGAEALLDADKKGRRGIFYLIPLLLILGGTAAYWLWPQGNMKPSEVKRLAQVQKLPKANAEPMKTEVIRTNERATVENHLPNTVNEQVSSQQPLSIVDLTKEPELVKPIASPAVIETMMYPVKNVTAPIQNETPTKIDNQVKSALSNGPQSAAEELNPSVVTPEPILPTVSFSTAVSSSSALPLSDLQAMEPMVAPIVFNGNKEDNNKNLNEKEIVPITITESLQVKEALKKPEEEKVASVLQDTSNKAALTNALITPTVLPNATLFMFLELGTAYNLGYQNLGSVDGRGFNPLFGLHLMSVINKNYSFSFGLQYQSIAHLNYSRHISKVTRYGLGEDSYVTVITPSAAHYLYLPLRFNYQMKENNVFSLGCNVGYLMNVSSKVETYNEHFNYVDNYKTYATGGYTEGFAMFETQIALAYRRRLYHDFWLRSELYVGLTDMKNNTFFSSDVFERNSGIKISLMYQLFKK